MIELALAACIFLLSVGVAVGIALSVAAKAESKAALADTADVRDELYQLGGKNGALVDEVTVLRERLESLERGRSLPAAPPPARLPTTLPPRPEPGAPEGPGVYSSVAPRLPSLEHEPPKQEGDSDHSGVPTTIGLGPAGPERDPRLATGVWASPGRARRGTS